MVNLSDQLGELARADEPICLLDSHVHLRSTDSLGRTLNDALSAFQNLLVEPGLSLASYALFLTQSANESVFAEIADNSLTLDGWSISSTGEAVSVVARSSRNDTMFLIAGHQVITAEKLEVLVIGQIQSPEERLSLNETVGRAKDAGSFVILPWGFGKWMGERGRLVTRFLASDESCGLCLGDNRGRPWFWPQPRQFDGEHRVLPGSDNLPLSGEQARIGSFACLLQGQIDLKTPWADIRRLIDALSADPPVCGERAGFAETLRNQLRMQRRKRRANS